MSTFGVSSVRYIHKAREPERAQPICAPRDKRAAAAGEDGEKRAKQAYEGARVAFEQLAANYRALEAELQAGAQRVTRVEAELKKEREKTGLYLAQIGKHDTEVRKLREGKEAAERLNSQLARPAGEVEELRRRAITAAKRADAAVASLAKTAKRADAAEASLAAAARRADAAELSAKAANPKDATSKIQACTEMLRHVDSVLDICANSCKDSDLSVGIRETQGNLRLFCEKI